MTAKILFLLRSTPSQKVRRQILNEMNSIGRVDEPVTIENYRDNLLNFADVLEESATYLESLNQAELKVSIEKQAMIAARLRHRFGFIERIIQ